MARSYGKTYLSIWGDGDFRALHPDAQRMYLFLTSQQDLSCVGTIPLRISRWANCAADQTAQQVRSALAELARGNFIVVDECHHYRGVFGSNVALVLRRLLRLCTRYAGAGATGPTARRTASPMSIWKAPTSTAAGSTRRFFRAARPRAARPIATW